MRISVVIACYNAQDTLGAQLEALAQQTYPDGFEVLLADNGSTDASVAIAESYLPRLPGLRVVDASQRRGPAHARNVAARAATTPWLAFCDADDVVAQDWLTSMARALWRHPFVGGRFESTLLNHGRVLRSRELQQDDELQRSPFGPDLPHAGAGNMGVHRDVFLGVGGFDESLTCLEDTDLSWRLQLTGVPLAFRPQAVVHVRLRSSWSGMWSQGLAYGRASALLERGFGKPESGQERPVEPEPVGPRSFPAKLLAIVREQRSLGGVLWQLGWHLGWRLGNPERRPADSVTSRVSEQEARRRAG